MEGKIDKRGELWIKRKSEYKPAYCPYMKNKEGGYYICDCTCAMFSEPFYRNEAGMADLSLCQKTLRFTKLIDERE